MKRILVVIGRRAHGNTTQFDNSFIKGEEDTRHYLENFVV